MRAPGFLLCLAVALLTGCPSPSSLCKSGVDQVCERQHECNTPEARATTVFQAVFGTSVDDCKTKLYANPTPGAQGIACDNVKTDQELCSNLGQPAATEFVLGKASECRDERAKLSCADYLAQFTDPTKAPPACNERCK
jgi:hypothetical protein